VCVCVCCSLDRRFIIAYECPPAIPQFLKKNNELNIFRFHPFVFPRSIYFGFRSQRTPPLNLTQTQTYGILSTSTSITTSTFYSITYGGKREISIPFPHTIPSHVGLPQSFVSLLISHHHSSPRYLFCVFCLCVWFEVHRSGSEVKK